MGFFMLTFALLFAIPCKNWIITENTRVCSKHFEKKYFKKSSIDKRVKRRQAIEISQLHRLSLKPSAIPHIFLGLPSHYNIKTTEPRATTALSSVRIEKENCRIQQQYQQLCAQDAIESFDILKERLTSLLFPVNCRYIIQDKCITFHCFDYDKVSLAPQLLVSVIVSNKLTFAAYKQSLKIKQNDFEHLLNQGHVSNGTPL